MACSLNAHRAADASALASRLSPPCKLAPGDRPQVHLVRAVGQSQCAGVRSGHPDAVEYDLAVAGVLQEAEHRQAALHPDARSVRRDQDHALPAVGLGMGISLAHHDRNLAEITARAGAPPPPSVDDVLIALAFDPGADVAGVGASDIGLGYAEAGSDLGLQLRAEPPLLLLRGPELSQDLHVALHLRHPTGCRR